MRMILSLVFSVGVVFLDPLQGYSQSAPSCTASITNVSFGGIDITENLEHSTTGTLSIECTGEPNQTLKVCLGFGAGDGGAAEDSDPRYLKAGTQTLAFNLYRPDNTTILTSIVHSIYLDASGQGSLDPSLRTLHARVPAGQQTSPAGLYSSNFVVDFSFGLDDCSSMGSSPTFQTSANIQSLCRVSTNPLDFGAVGLIDGNIDGSTNLAVTCTSGANYLIKMDNGQNGTTPLTRRMKKGGEYIQYGLYRNAARAAADVWGSEQTNTSAGTGTGSAQSYSVYGRVPPQSTPTAGVYQDTVVVIIEY